MTKKEILQMIEPYKTNIHQTTLKRKVKGNTKTGIGNLFLIDHYGCEKCQLSKYCKQKRPGEICYPRSQLFVTYFKQRRGEMIPLMKEQLAKLEIEREMEHAKGIVRGEMTPEWFKINQLCIELTGMIYKVEEGIKMNISHEHSYLLELTEAVKKRRDEVIKLKEEPTYEPSSEGSPS